MLRQKVYANIKCMPFFLLSKLSCAKSKSNKGDTRRRYSDSFKFSELFDKENIRGDTNEKGFNKSCSYSNDSCYPNYSYTTLRKRYFRQQITDFLVPHKRHGTQLRSSLRYYGKHRKGVQLQTRNYHPRQQRSSERRSLHVEWFKT